MIKRYFATKDNTITNAFDESLTTRGVSGSMGLSDILEVFSIYGQVSSPASGFSLEEARVLVEFDLTQIEADIANKTIPSNAKYFLRLFNAEHGETIPREYNLNVNSVNGAWQEGLGLDMEGYKDLSSGFGSNWIMSQGNPVAATAPLDMTNDIVLTSVAKGRARNTNTFKTIVNAPAANAANAVLVGFTGTTAAIVCTITPDDTGPVTLTTAELVELINTGAVVGKTVTIADTSSFRALQAATGGGAQDLAAGGEGDDKTAVFSGGDGQWVSEGGDVHATPSATQFLDTGLEDLDVDVTSQVALWLDDTNPNNGFLVKLPTSLVDGTQQRSYYTKRFFARGSEFFHKRPCLEVRWNSQVMDDRVNFYSSSSLAPAVDNLNTLYLYNYHRGQLANIPSIGEGNIYVNLYETLGGSPLAQCIDTPATGGYVSTGIYTASVCLQTTASTIHDVWHSGSQASTVLTFGPNVPSNGPLAINFSQLGTFTLTFDNTAASTDADVGNKASTVLTFGPEVPSNGPLVIAFGEVGTFTLTFDSAAGSTDPDIGSDNAATIDPSAERDSAGNAQRVLLLLRDGVEGDVIKNAYDFAYDGSSVGAETVTITAKEKGSTHNITVTETLSNISSVVTTGSDNTATINQSIEGDSAGNAQRTLLLLRDGVTGDRIKNAYDFAYDGSSVGAETVTITAKEKGPTHNIVVTETLDYVSSVVSNGSMINYHSGTIDVKQSTAITAAPDNNLVVTVSNNRSFHYKDQTSRFYLYIRQKNWSPNIFTTATTVPQTEVFENLYYKIIKVATDETIFDYDTTNNSTLLSYDSRGNYFDLDIGMLEPNYTYQVELSLYNVATKSYEQLSFKHKFRVVNNEY
jgi:hypothetical protein